jgi:hypothetical protein
LKKIKIEPKKPFEEWRVEDFTRADAERIAIKIAETLSRKSVFMDLVPCQESEKEAPAAPVKLDIPEVLERVNQKLPKKFLLQSVLL